MITRTPEQFKHVLERNPFPGTDTSRLYFSLLSSQPASKLLEAFIDIDFSPDEVKVIYNTIYTLDKPESGDNVERLLAALELHWLDKLQPFGERGYNSAKGFQRKMVEWQNQSGVKLDRRALRHHSYQA